MDKTDPIPLDLSQLQSSSRLAEQMNPFHHLLYANQISQKQIPQSEILEIPFEENSVDDMPYQPDQMSHLNIPRQYDIQGNDDMKNDKDNFWRVMRKQKFIFDFIKNLKRHAYIYPYHLGEKFAQLSREQYLKVTEEPQLAHKFFVNSCINKIPLFGAQNKFMLFWEILFFMQLLFLTYWGPFVASFKPEANIEIIILENITFYYTILDILLKNNKSIIVQGDILSDRLILMKRYLKNEFLIDFFSLVVQSILNSQSEISSDSIFLLASILQLYLNYMRFQRMMEKLQESFNIQDELQELVKVLLIIFYFAHVTACIWHKIGLIGIQNGYKSWMTVNIDIDQQSIWVRYNYAFYWATMTMVTVGYGDITPQNNYELVCSSMIMIISSAIFGYSINSIGLILKNINESNQKLRKNQLIINNYMIKNQVNQELQSKVRNYLRYQNQQECSQNEEEIQQLIEKLSSSLKSELVYEIQSRPMKYCKYFVDHLSQQSQKQVAYKLQSHNYAKNELIFQQNHIDDQALYIILNGEVKLVDEQSRQIYQIVHAGECFGEYEFFTGRNRQCSAYCNDFTQTYKITRNQILTILHDYPEDKEKFFNIQDQILYSNQFTAAGLECYCCKSHNHYINQCPFINYIPDLEKLIKEEGFQTQNRKYKKRRYKRSDCCLLLLKDINQHCDKFYTGSLLDQEMMSPEQISEENSFERSQFRKNAQQSSSSDKQSFIEPKISLSQLDKSQVIQNEKPSLKRFDQSIKKIKRQNSKAEENTFIRRKNSLLSHCQTYTNLSNPRDPKMLDEQLIQRQFNFCDIDKMYQFKYYMPHNNLLSALIQYSRAPKRTILRSRQDIFKYSFFNKIYKYGIKTKQRNSMKPVSMALMKIRKSIRTHRTQMYSQSVIRLHPAM